MRDHGLADHADAPAERGLDLPGLDAEAADLDLVVEPAQELQRAVGAPAHEVAGAVQALPGAGRVGHEALRGQLRATEVAAGDAVAADVQLAGLADRHGPAVRIQDVDPVLAMGRPMGTIVPAAGVLGEGGSR